MPIARFQMPDGRVGRFEVPEGTTPEQAQSLIETHLQTSPVDTGPDPTEGTGALRRGIEGVGMGMTNVARGLGQAIGAVSRDDIAEARRLDAPLARTTAGKVGDVLGTAAALGPLALIPGVNTWTGAALAGAGTGMLAPSTSTDETVANTMIGGVAGPVAKAAGAGIGRGIDWAKGELGNIGAGKLMRDILGPKLEQFRAALLMNRDQSLTAGQIAEQSGVQDAGLQALEKFARARAPNEFNAIEANQIAARKETLKNVTPGQETAETLRKMAGDIQGDQLRSIDAKRLQRIADFEKAKALDPSIQVPERMTPALKALKADKKLQSVIEAAEDTVRNARRDLENPMESFEGLELMKKAMDTRVKEPSVVNRLQNYSTSQVMAAKQRLLAATDELTEGRYKQMRDTFGRLSKPVDQSMVLQKMAANLTDNMDGEKIRTFMNALGTGENALLKRSTGSPRYNALSDVLSPQQYNAVKGIENQLRRDVAMADRAGSGSVVAADVMRMAADPAQVPHTLTVAGSLTNTALRSLQGWLNRRSLNALAKGMQRGDSTLQLLDAVPAADRMRVLKALQAAGAPTAGGAVNALNVHAQGVYDQ